MYSQFMMHGQKNIKSVLIAQKLGWASGPVWTDAETSLHCLKQSRYTSMAIPLALFCQVNDSWEVNWKI